MAKSFINKCDGMTLEAIATELNNNGFKTSQGKKFYKTSVKRLRETI